LIAAAERHCLPSGYVATLRDVSPAG